MDTVFASSPASAISVASLRDQHARAASPLIIDVRRRVAFDAASHMIAGAIWRDPFVVAEWAHFLPRHRAVVVYCVHGHELSKNTSDALREHGVNARILAGGIEAWAALSGPLVRKSNNPQIPTNARQATVWVTRERPKIDRIACPWLIRRFLDPLAEFAYVPSNQVLEFARQNQAIAYDVPGVTFTHRGDLCSFDALIADFDLDDSALLQLAAIVRGADTDNLALTPQSPGLLAISLGLSTLYTDDQQMLALGLHVYDALYAWCRQAQGESHNADLFKQ